MIIIKTKHIAVVVIIVVALITIGVFVAGTKQRSIDMTSLTYEQLCLKNGDEWMVMQPWRNHERMAGAPCAGCMIGGNHFCESEGYVDYIRTLPSFGSKPDTEEMSGMQGMEQGMMHEAMTASGGYKDAVDIHLYEVKFLRERLSENQTAFLITQDGSPVTDLDIVHDKIMHLVLVRDDLRYFDHIHPQQTSQGVYSVPYEFSSAGIYRVWADFTIDGMQHIVAFDTDIITNETKPEPDRLDGLGVKMDLPENPVAGRTSRINFIVTENGSPVKITEKFLAANAHLVAIHETLDEFGHNHDETFDGDNVLSFEHKFEKAGLHKLWVQFSAGGQERTAEFTVNVNE